MFNYSSLPLAACRLVGFATALAAAVATGAPSASTDPSSEHFAAIRCDPSQVMGSETCVKCHGKELEQWRTTPHFATFESLHRSPEAKAIAEKLDLRSVKRNDVCIKCHYTCQEVEGKTRVTEGVSCESCHGGAKQWFELHADYGGKNVTREQESTEHRLERIQKSVAAGMNNPHNLYLVARQCLACHTSPDERLVNVGGHKPGTLEFELVAWSQGMVRHNFVRSGGASNAPSSPERLRAMFVVGVMADLEASLRATAIATEKATFGVTAAKRAAQQKKRLYEIAQVIDNQLVRDALEAATAVKLKLNNREALLEAANRIGQIAFEFAETAEKADLRGVDPLLPAESTYRWQARP